MKDPTLHIRLSDLTQILREEEIDCIDPRALAIRVLQRAHKQGVQIRNRSMIKTTVRKGAKINKLTATDSKTADVFQGILVIVRRAAGHKMVKVLKPSDSQFALLKEVAELAAAFCADFGLPQMEGMVSFCEIGLKLIGKNYGLSKFKYYSEQIGAYLECQAKIEIDSNRAATNDMYLMWAQMMQQETGFVRELEDPREFVNILYAREQADECKATHEDWLTAQFEGFKWLSITPEPYQLHGDKAKGRYDLYMTHKGSLTKSKAELAEAAVSDGPQAYWDALAKLGADDDDE